MATGKDGIQGYAGGAAVVARHQIIVGAQAHGSGSEQCLLLPMIEQAEPFSTSKTVITTDAWYHSEANLKPLTEKRVLALIAAALMRKRNERVKDQGK